MEPLNFVRVVGGRSSEKISGFFNCWTVSKYGLLTKCEVKMAGDWPSSSPSCLAKKKKKNEANNQQSWPNKLSLKDLLYGFRGNVSCGIRRVVPRVQDSSILPARGARHITNIAVNVLIFFRQCKRSDFLLQNWFFFYVRQVRELNSRLCVSLEREARTKPLRQLAFTWLYQENLIW